MGGARGGGVARKEGIQGGGTTGVGRGCRGRGRTPLASVGEGVKGWGTPGVGEGMRAWGSTEALCPLESRISGWSGWWAPPPGTEPGRPPASLAAALPPPPQQLGRLAQQVCGTSLPSLAPPPLGQGLGSREAAWLKGPGFVMGGALFPVDPRASVFRGSQARTRAAAPARWVCGGLRRHLPLGRFLDDASTPCSVLQALVTDDGAALPTCPAW